MPPAKNVSIRERQLEPLKKIFQQLDKEEKKKILAAKAKRAAQVIRHIGAQGLDRRGPAGSCRLFLGPGFRLGARWNRLGETVKTRKKRGGNGGRNGRDTRP